MTIAIIGFACIIAGVAVASAMLWKLAVQEDVIFVIPALLFTGLDIMLLALLGQIITLSHLGR